MTSLPPKPVPQFEPRSEKPIKLRIPSIDREEVKKEAVKIIRANRKIEDNLKLL